ncbi:MAG TPA: ribonuclease III [Acidobacteriota bacterium]|nr:ribonuclease III [Acidobacteriota bacterium]
MPHTAKFNALQKRLGYTFRNPALLGEALRHASFLQDHPDGGAHNQRLEFLGDSVLHFILTDALFREYTTEREGVLSRRRAGLTKGEFLCQLARDLGVDAAVQLGQSEEDAGGRGRDSILEDALEAIIGAIYLDSDFATVQAVVTKWYGSIPDRLARTEGNENPKGQLQEIVQPEHGNGALRYDVVNATGPKHAREYEVVVLLNGREIGLGKGSSKKAAEEEAARVGLETLRYEQMDDAQ